MPAPINATTASEIPAWSGSHGPGEITTAAGSIAASSSALDRVVAEDRGGGAELAEVLHQVVGEGVVVVDDGDNSAERGGVHRPTPWLASSTAASSAATLLSISSASSRGSESATIPADAWA